MFLKRVYSEFRQLGRFLARKWYNFNYVSLDINRQKLALLKYESNIVESYMCLPATSQYFCIFVYHEPNGSVSGSVRRIIGVLNKKGVNVILATNTIPSDLQRQFFEKNTHSYVVRKNQGFDFGAYKDVFLQIIRKNESIDRLIFLNDSVFYSSKGLDQMVDGLLSNFDVVALYENWGEQYHIQSFGISVSREVINSNAFINFWEKYTPISNRIYAIENGEKELSRAALSSAKTSKVIYSTSNLRTQLAQDKNFDIQNNLRVIVNPWRNMLEQEETNSGRDFSPDKVCEIVNMTSTIHSGAYLFPKYLNSPTYKKDLVYRGRFSFWEIENWIEELMPKDEAVEFLTMLRIKGDYSSLSKSNKLKYEIGVK